MTSSPHLITRRRRTPPAPPQAAPAPTKATPKAAPKAKAPAAKATPSAVDQMPHKVAGAQRRKDMAQAQQRKILDAGVLDRLIDIAQGRPLPVMAPRKDGEGDIVVAYEQVSPEARASVLVRLANKVIADLKSVDLTNDSGASVTIMAPFALPDAGRQNRELLITADQLTDAVRHQINHAATEDDEHDD